MNMMNTMNTMNALNPMHPVNPMNLMNALNAPHAKPDEPSDDPRKTRPAEYWLREIDAALSREKPWRNEAVAALRRYTLEGSGGGVDGGGKFNILWSNTETLRNAIYNQPPKPDVRQRWPSQDAVALGAAEVLDRALTYTIERSGFDVVARRAVLDYLLPGRAVVRVRYAPVMEPGLDAFGTPFERVAFENVAFENVSWADFCHSDAKTWERVEWVAFRHLVTRADAKALFPERFDDLAYSSLPLGRSGEADDVLRGETLACATRSTSASPDDARACVWEVWDKRAGRVIWVSRGAGGAGGGGGAGRSGGSAADDALLETPPPLDLEGFFPCCRPLFAIDQPDSLLPLPLYSQYKEQAEELDRVSLRIKRMVRVIKWRGAYDTSLGADIARIMNEGEDGSLVPTDSAMQWIERGGLAGAIWLMPLGEAVAALDRLYQSRDQTKAVIYEITGISDVLRGTSNPNETATAQNIKAAWGSSRVDGMKRELQRFFKETLLLAAEVLGELFQIDTLAAMTGLDYPRAFATQADAAPTGPASPISPTWEAIAAVLASDRLRSFRVDIETDSTIAPDQRAEAQAFGETMRLLGGLMQQVLPGVQSGIIPKELALGLLAATIRKTPLANELGGLMQKYESELAGGANPAQGQIEALKKENARLRDEMNSKQAELAVKNAAVQQKAQQVQGEQALQAMDLQLKAAELREKAVNACRPE